MNYWLFKSEPDEYSIDDLQQEKKGIGTWIGVRNFQARNYLKDKVCLGDKVFFYHSSCKKVGIAGIATVVKEAYPDTTQFDSASPYYDSKSSHDNPRWFSVSLQFNLKIDPVISLNDLRTKSELAEMVLLKQGRLSIQPVSCFEWEFINALLL